jgi:hypothetical protein
MRWTMVDPEIVIAESRPMLEEFLADVGIYNGEESLGDPRLLERFSDWISRQVIPEEGVIYLTVRVAAFICEYVIERQAGERIVEGGRILLRLPVDEGRQVFRQFDPFPVALGVVRERRSLKEFVVALTR